ncbi:hypothetical protein N1851_001801 [Merluccius polli]|uniref:Band 4.1 C-terminal domain-containing protein n=1 Tax=Merluccius polli TaxID=89951 RepID=A0AA47PCM7_MERPO|nr:hypothetical protein N1851_001801 [Merluccius polli]
MFQVTSDGSDGDKDSSTTFSSESGATVTMTTTHISKVVKSGSTETRVEKRIVITADSEADERAAQGTQQLAAGASGGEHWRWRPQPDPRTLGPSDPEPSDPRTLNPLTLNPRTLNPRTLGP